MKPSTLPRYDDSESNIPEKQFSKLLHHLGAYHETLKSVKDFSTPEGSLLLCDDEQTLHDVNHVTRSCGHCDLLIIVGIGGSNLGTYAVEMALGPVKIPVLYADTVDAVKLALIRKKMLHVLKAGGRVILNAISKSGTTTETVANFFVLEYAARTYISKKQCTVVITSDEKSQFHKLAERKKYLFLRIPSLVGGRYSVFSSVGLFPLKTMGININKLRKGALAMLHHCMLSKLQHNPAARSATIHAHFFMHHVRISDFFTFSPQMEGVGKWYRQLLAESIGKEFDLSGKRVFCGITPTVSVGSTDLHSMAQLYLGGPYDKLTTFISVQKPTSSLQIPDQNIVDGISGKSFRDVMTAIYRGVTTAYTQQKRPFMEITLDSLDELNTGALLQLKMLEVMYLGNLLQVNAFDQPNVESYKSVTRNILKR